MASVTDTYLRSQLEERRQRLQGALDTARDDENLIRLLGEVDAALSRMANGTYGICEVCHDPVDGDRLLADPLLRFCIDHLSEPERRALEADMQVAARIQRSLLPPPHQRFDGWEMTYRYEPAGPVSGDFCDVVAGPGDARNLMFLFGDVSGKGVPAALLMSHLHAIFRSLTAAEEPVHQLVERANSVFRATTLSPYFATLVSGRARHDGSIEICNAGHCPPLLLSKGIVTTIDPTGLPVGTFYSNRYASRQIRLDPDDTLILYTDGLSEAANHDDEEYGSHRLAHVLKTSHRLAVDALADACLADLATHLGGRKRTDDLTLMVLRRNA